MALFKSNPTKKLQKAYEAKQREAQDAQRSGDIQAFADLTKDADDLFRQLEAAKSAS